MTDKEEWAAIWKEVASLSAAFPDGVVFIGGVAVYLYAVSTKAPPGWAEFSHDADLLIGFADLAELRDLEELTPNRRLSKAQFVRSGVEFDVYIERQHSLRVSYADALRYSVVLDGVRVAALEHLLLLKLDAYSDRKGSAKGDKDERDLVRIVRALSRRHAQAKLFEHYVRDEDISMLDALSKSRTLRDMVKTPREAATLRMDVAKVIAAMARAIK